MSTFDLSAQLFLQLAVILLVCRVVGFLAQRVGQPQVVGEMVAGVVLGPSFFGALWPAAQLWMFPLESKPILFSFSQVGIALYMFLVGVEFNRALIRSRLRSAASVSLAGIATPFVLGAGAAWMLMSRAPLFSQRTSPVEGMLFLGAAMSITAFPMLARIIYERGLTGTSLGTLALAAGSIDDAAAWCVLAIVLASFQSDPWIAALAIGGGVLYTAFVLLILRRGLQVLGTRCERDGLTPSLLAITLILVMGGAWFTDYIGIYAVFGAFVMGLAMPRGRFSRSIQQQLEPVVTTFLLPVFFVYTGLNTELSLVLSSPQLIGIATVLLVLAIAGKGLACYVAALVQGESHREAMAIGVLMNARGLMELIILNIGLEHGVITPTLFTIMVNMAIVTTLMTSPAFELVYGRHRSAVFPA
ncbi:MAG: cation:proton antiporter [Pirellulaceae bacterium]